MRNGFKNFEWKRFLGEHPLFSDLHEEEIDKLLQSNVSRSQQYISNEVILQSGEPGNEIYLIGEGIVQVLIERKEDHTELELSTLQKNDIFGEMALIQKPRTATVKAMTDCLLLEVNGNSFRQLMDNHPSISLKMIVEYSERLKKINDKLADEKISNATEKLAIYDKKFHENLTAAHDLLNEAISLSDRTEERSNALITDAEKTRRLFRSLGIAATGILSIAGSLFAWFGFTRFSHFTAKFKEAEQSFAEIKKIKEEAKNIKEEAENISKPIEVIQTEYEDFHQILLLQFESYLNQVNDNPDQKESNQRLAYRTYHILRGSTIKNYNEANVERLLSNIETSIYSNRRNNYTDLIWELLNYVKNSCIEDKEKCSNIIFKEKFKLYYLLLSNAVLNNQSGFKIEDPEKSQSFDQVIIEFKEFVEESKPRIDKKNETLILQSIINKSPEMRPSFQAVDKLINRVVR